MTGAGYGQRMKWKWTKLNNGNPFRFPYTFHAVRIAFGFLFNFKCPLSMCFIYTSFRLTIKIVHQSNDCLSSSFTSVDRGNSELASWWTLKNAVVLLDYAKLARIWDIAMSTKCWTKQTSELTSHTHIHKRIRTSEHTSIPFARQKLYVAYNRYMHRVDRLVMVSNSPYGIKLNFMISFSRADSISLLFATKFIRR